jgi:type IV pilus assembly protein PilA
MRRVAGFTLVEIMIVVGVIALLVVIALPSFLRAREKAQNAKLMNGLRVAADVSRSMRLSTMLIPQM